MLQLRQPSIPECEIHQILANPRRRETLRHLGTVPGSISLRELSESIAAFETDETPAPRCVRESVYVSLHQTHLPRLQELGVIRYDLDTKEVELLDGARDVDRYMDVVTRYGVTWGEYYRALGVLGLTAVVAASVEAPLVSAVDPLLWASGSLVAFALSSAYQLWSDRFSLLRLLRR